MDIRRTALEQQGMVTTTIHYIDEGTDKAQSWDAVDDDAYDQLAYYCGLDIGDYDSRDDLMDDCLVEIEKDEKER